MTIHTFDYIAGTNFPLSDEIKKLIAIDELLEQGGVVVGHTVYVYDDDVRERWAIRKDEKAAATPLSNVQVRLIQNIEVRETFSKSKQQMFKYLRCMLDDDSDFVNIFDHPDDSRNTFKIITARGWFDDLPDDWLYVGLEIDLDIPVAVTISNDGEWNSLVDIMEHDKYALICSQEQIFDMTTPAPRDDDDDESEIDTEALDWIKSATHDSVDRLQQGISFDSDEPGSIADYEVPPQADYDPDDDDV